MANGTTKELFALYVERLEGDADLMDEALIMRLRWFGEDVATAQKRLADNPLVAFEVVRGLSSAVQELDARAGAVEQIHGDVLQARRHYSLLVVEGPSGEDEPGEPGESGESVDEIGRGGGVH